MSRRPKIRLRDESAGTRSRKRVVRDEGPIFVSPRYSRYLNAQRERLKADALARWGKSTGATVADDR